MITPAHPFEQEIPRVAGNGANRLNLAAMPFPVRPATESAPAPVDLAAAEDAVRRLLVALGENPDREGLRDTPRRVAKSFAEMMGGRVQDAREILSRTFEHRGGGPVMLRDIEFSSLCEHHLLPFVGKAHVAYLPGPERVVGLSKLARLVDVYARRPQMQERLTQQIADALMEHLGARGVVVVVEGEHMCMKLRGVMKSQPVMKTLALRGIYEMNPELRREILGLLGVSAA